MEFTKFGQGTGTAVFQENVVMSAMIEPLSREIEVLKKTLEAEKAAYNEDRHVSNINDAEMALLKTTNEVLASLTEKRNTQHSDFIALDNSTDQNSVIAAAELALRIIDTEKEIADIDNHPEVKKAKQYVIDVTNTTPSYAIREKELNKKQARLKALKAYHKARA